MLFAAGAAVGLAFSGGCATRSRPAMTREPESRIEHHRIGIPATPVMFQGDYATPDKGIHQLFRWQRGHHEWHLTVLDPESTYAGLFLRRPLSIPKERDVMSLYFELQPPEAAEMLAIGLRDKRERKPAQNILMVPIAPYRVQPRTADRGGYFVIPLSHLEQDPALNWDSIIGVQLNFLEQPTLSSRHMIIRHLQIAPTQILDQRFAD